MKKNIVIFIPAHNEERSIGSVVLLAKKYGKVFVVDDGSTDATARVASEAGAALISHRKNLGYGAALKSIFEAAAEMEFGALVLLDADFQHDPAQIPQIAAPVLSGRADVALGSRFLGRFEGASAARKLGVGALNRLNGMGTGGKALDFECGFRAFGKRAVEKIKFWEAGYAASSEIAAAAQAGGLKVAEVPVAVRYFEQGRKNALVQGAGLVGYVVGKIARRKPLAIFCVAGTICMLLSGGLGVFVADTYLESGNFAIGSAFLTVFFGIAGLVLVLLGINLYMLGKMLEDGKA
jgi:glycosyltransferase involved in cell wall biosynthesis